MWPAILGMTFAILPEEKAGLAGGIILGAAGLGNALGPLIGGVLTDALSWRWIFFLNVPISVFAVLVTYFLVHVKEPEAEDQRIDYPGIAALSVGLVSLLIALDQVADWGWGDPRVIGAAGAGRGPDRRLRAARAARRRRTRWCRARSCATAASPPPASRSSSCRRPSSPRCSTCRSSWRSSSATRRWRPGSGSSPSSASSPSSPSSPGRSTTASARSRWPSSAPPASPSRPFLFSQVDAGSSYGSLVPGHGRARGRDRQLLPDRDDRRRHLGRRLPDQPRRRHRLHVPDRRRLDRAGPDDDHLLRARSRPSSTASRRASGSTRRSRWSAS